MQQHNMDALASQKPPSDGTIPFSICVAINDDIPAEANARGRIFEGPSAAATEHLINPAMDKQPQSPTFR